MSSQRVFSTIWAFEESPTLRYLLRKHMAPTGIPVTFFEDLTALLDAPEARLPDALLLGWPGHRTERLEWLENRLTSHPWASRPVLILIREDNPQLIGWSIQRPRTLQLAWPQADRLPEAISRLNETKAGERFIGQLAPDPDLSVLLVDDSRSIRQVYGRLLNRHGYRTDTCASVQAAYQRALTHHYDLAVIDYFMPEQTGDVLCRLLQEHPGTRHIYSAILTATYRESVIQVCLRNGARECMFKDEAQELFLARIAAIGRSIERHKRNEAERARLDTLIASLGEGVYGADRSGRITFLNPATRRILGFEEPSERFIGQPASLLLHHYPADASLETLENAYREAAPLLDHETLFWHRSGRPLPVECTVQPFGNGPQGGVVVVFREISQRKAWEQDLLRQAYIDPLTELYNRRRFEELLRRELERLEQVPDQASALLFIDLDRFKQVNDTVGHEAGDQLLQQVGQRLQRHLRSTDKIARLGGDEFAVILPDIDRENLFQAADRIRGMLERFTFRYEDRTFKINGSVGVTRLGDTPADISEVLRQADLACQTAKRKGRNQTHTHVPQLDPDSGNPVLVQDWQNRLEQALHEDCFVLHFQPIVPITGPAVDLDRSTTAVAYEVLIRLADRDGGLVFPTEFFAAAERYNLLHAIDRWVLERLEKLLQAGSIAPERCLFVNLAAGSIQNETARDQLQTILDRGWLTPHNLVLELSETTAIECYEQAGGFLDHLQSQGFQFALDDFGTGFTSLVQLHTLPVTYVKFDGFLGAEQAAERFEPEAFRQIADLAHRFERTTIAEHIEDAEQLAFVREAGITLAQGFHIGHPVPLEQLPPPQDIAGRRGRQRDETTAGR